MALVGCPALVARTIGLDAMPVPEDLPAIVRNRRMQSFHFHTASIMLGLACIPRYKRESEIDSTTIDILPPVFVECSKRSSPMLYIDTAPAMAQH